MAIRKSITHDLLNAIGWILAYASLLPILFYIKNKLFNMRFVSIIILWRQRDTLYNHTLFRKLKEFHTIRLPFNVISLGKKMVFGDLIQIEAESIERYLTEYLNQIFHTKKNKPNLRKYVQTAYQETETEAIILKLLEQYDNYLLYQPVYMVTCIVDEIEVTRMDMQVYIRHNLETNDITTEQSEEIRNILRYKKARLVIARYEEMMIIYRSQIKRNLVMQFKPDKPPIELLHQVMTNCFLNVILNMQETLSMQINKLNGELNHISYKGYPLYEKHKKETDND